MKPYIRMHLILLACALFISTWSCQDVDKPGAGFFEVSASTYAWEVHDEGVGYLLDNMQNIAAVNSVYLIALMHHEPRPYNCERFPHNPVRQKWFAEDSRISWHPDQSLYDRLKPERSDFEWLRETDWLKVVVDSAHKRGMKAGVEISHTILSNKLLSAAENMDLIQRTATGEPAHKWSGDYLPCLNNNDIQAYLCAIYRDLARNYDLDYIQTCMVNFATGGVREGGCFCNSCLKKAKENGIDLELIRSALLSDSESQPYKDQWLEFRRKSVTELYRKIAHVIHEENPGIDFRLNNWRRNPEVDGLYLGDIKESLSSVRIMSYQEQEGEPELLAGKADWIKKVIRDTEDQIPVLAAIGVRNRAYPDLVKQGIKVSVESGVEGITLGHYDGAAYSILRAVRNGLSEAGIPGIQPIIGVEAEEMDLDNYFENPWLYERCINTDGVGSASYKFQDEPGYYDIRISYADEKGGCGEMKLYVNSTIVDAWSLDQEFDCWKIRTIREVKLSRGDEIRIEGRADRSDWARLDHLEFIPAN